MTAEHERDHSLDDPVLDWSLRERLGGERPPDLLAGVQARLACGPQQAIGSQRTAHWFVAAIVLLGLGVVFGIALGGDAPQAGTPIAEVPEPAPQEPAIVPVASRSEIEALPLATRGVEAQGIDDDDLRALARLRNLEVLSVREPFQESFGLALKMSAPQAPRELTAAAWPQLLSFTKLRRLELSGTRLLGRLDEAQLAAFAAGLEALPLLESLTLRFQDTSDALVAALAKARGLRRLDLSFNHGFFADGVASLLRCRDLHSLSLRGCQQLGDRELATLAKLPELEELDLSLIDGINWRNTGGELDDQERAVFERAQRHTGRRAMGPGSETLAALGSAPKLRVLDLAGARLVTAAGLAELGACATLRELDLSGCRDASAGWIAALPQELERLEVCGDYPDAFCAAVASHLTHLRHLSMAACYQITDRGLAVIAAMPSLRVLDMRQMRGLSPACLDALLAAHQLEELDVSHCDFVTARDLAALRHALPRLRRLATSLDPDEPTAPQGGSREEKPR